MEDSHGSCCGLQRRVKDSVVKDSQGECCGLWSTVKERVLDSEGRLRIVLWAALDSQGECCGCGGQLRSVMDC